VALLKPASISAPAAGMVLDIGKDGTFIHQGGLIARLQHEQQTIEVRSPIRGRMHQPSILLGSAIIEGVEIAVVDPPEEQVWEALRALYLVGQPEDLTAIRMYERELPDGSNRVRQQAVRTEQAILGRAKQQP